MTIPTPPKYPTFNHPSRKVKKRPVKETPPTPTRGRYIINTVILPFHPKYNRLTPACQIPPLGGVILSIYLIPYFQPKYNRLTPACQINEKIEKIEKNYCMVAL
jgi:hypothetical protein